MSNEYKDAPVSLNEIRSDRKRDASLWTARDVLIFLLREIDAGNVAPDELVVAYRYKDVDFAEQGYKYSYARSGDDKVLSAGMLVAVQHMLVE